MAPFVFTFNISTLGEVEGKHPSLQGMSFCPLPGVAAVEPHTFARGSQRYLFTGVLIVCTFETKTPVGSHSLKCQP